MKRRTQILSFCIILVLVVTSCSTEAIRNIAGPGGSDGPGQVTEVNPVDINKGGFDFMEKMQGHWVGNNLVINQEYPFFAWDYRPISASHTFGIHEGGSWG